MKKEELDWDNIFPEPTNKSITLRGTAEEIWSKVPETHEEGFKSIIKEYPRDYKYSITFWEDGMIGYNCDKFDGEC